MSQVKNDTQKIGQLQIYLKEDWKFFLWFGVFVASLELIGPHITWFHINYILPDFSVQLLYDSLPIATFTFLLMAILILVFVACALKVGRIRNRIIELASYLCNKLAQFSSVVVCFLSGYGIVILLYTLAISLYIWHCPSDRQLCILLSIVLAIVIFIGIPIMLNLWCNELVRLNYSRKERVFFVVFSAFIVLLTFIHSKDFKKTVPLTMDMSLYSRIQSDAKKNHVDVNQYIINRLSQPEQVGGQESKHNKL